MAPPKNKKDNITFPAYTVIRDTREQKNKGWIFEENKECEGTIIRTMKTGDYTLVGLEKVLTIERKFNVAEFAGNIIEERFERELERMEEFPLPFAVCEFTYDDIWRWPLNSGLSPSIQKKIRITRAFILKRLTYYETKYKCKFILAGSHAKEVVSSIFRRVNEQYNKTKELENE